MTSFAPMRALLARLRLGGERSGTCAGVVALLAVFAAFAVAGSRHDSVTVDEFAIVPSGYAKLLHPGMANWLNPVNPPLGQLAVALPLLARGAHLPEAWLGAETPERENWESFISGSPSWPARGNPGGGCVFSEDSPPSRRSRSSSPARSTASRG
jgi:hypothetical protein